MCMGCGDGSTTINGTVMFDDGSPLSQGVVSLSSAQFSYNGTVNPDGTYSVESVMPGTYKVAITGTEVGGAATMDDDDSMNYDEDGEYVEEAPTTVAESLIAAKFADASTSGIEISVPGDYGIKVSAQ